MSKLQETPYASKVIKTLTGTQKTTLAALINGSQSVPTFKSLINPSYYITTKGVFYICLECRNATYTGYLVYTNTYCVLFAYKENTQDMDILNINLTDMTCSRENEYLNILELRFCLEEEKESIDVTAIVNQAIANGDIQASKVEGNTEDVDENTPYLTDIDIDGSDYKVLNSADLKTINGNEIVGSGDIVISTEGTLVIDTELDETSENAVQNKVIATALADKADINSYYQGMGAGYADVAENLLATKGLTVNDDPMYYGVTGGEQKSAVGDGNATLNKLTGVSVVNNQLIQNGNFADTSGWVNNGCTISVSNNVVEITATSDTSNCGIYRATQIVSNHVCLMIVDAKSNISNLTIHFQFSSGIFFVTDEITSSWKTFIGIKTTGSGNTSAFYFGNATTGDVVYMRNAQYIDLTQYFGSDDIPTYVQTLETAEAGTGIAWLRTNFPALFEYSDYDTGTPVSSQSGKMISTGFNRWDESNLENITGFTKSGDYWVATGTVWDAFHIDDNYIDFIPNQQYCISFEYTNDSGLVNPQFQIVYTDGTDYTTYLANATISNGRCIILSSSSKSVDYFRFRYGSGGGNNIYIKNLCINESNASLNGTYKPYMTHTTTLPNDELRGVLKLDSNNNLYADGDYELSDGEKHNRYGIVNLGTLTFNKTQSGDSQTIWQMWDSSVIANLSIKSASSNGVVANIICSKYTAIASNTQYNNASTNDMTISISNSGYITLRDSSTDNMTASQLSEYLNGQYLVYELATETTETTDAFTPTFPVEQGGTIQFVKSDGTDIDGLQGNEIFYQKNIKSFIETFGEAISWSPERIARLADLSFTPWTRSITLSPAPDTGAYMVYQIMTGQFSVVISAIISGTANGTVTLTDATIDLSVDETSQLAATKIYDMDGKKASEAPTTENCNVASFVGRDNDGVFLWSLIHTGANQLKVHFEEVVSIDANGKGKIDCRATLTL